MRALIGTAALWAAVALLLTGPVTEAHAAASSTRQAPVGHRQPTAEDVQGAQQENSADQAMKKIDEDLDKKLKGICRGC
jgi:ABC-type sugar transport system substrate-binding protein